MSASLKSVKLLLLCIRAFFRTHREQAIVELALRQQLAIYRQKRSRPTLTRLDRAFWVALSRLWPRWRSATVRFRLLYVWFVIDHGRRKILHFDVTANPSAPWVVQQLREAFSDAASPAYLIYDNDSIFSERVSEAIRRFGMRPMRTAYRSPWQNGTAERWVGVPAESCSIT